MSALDNTFTAFRCWLCAAFSGIIFTACTSVDQRSIDSTYLAGLADTVYAGEKRLVFLGDGTGGFFYDDATGEAFEGEFGYSRFERKYVAGWELLNEAGEILNQGSDFTIIHPEYIQRVFPDGMVERIHSAYRKPGLLLEFEAVDAGFIFSPIFDFRHLEKEESPLYVHDYDSPGNVVNIARTDGVGGWIAVAFEDGADYYEELNTRRFQYRFSELKGRPGVAVAFSVGEFRCNSQSSARFAIGWGVDLQTASRNASALLQNFDSEVEKRRDWLCGVLGKIILDCDDKEFIKSYAWARLLAAQLIAETQAGSVLLTGIPFDAHANGWFTCISLAGLTSLEFSPDQVYPLIEPILHKQNQNELSRDFGMLPGDITEDGADYRIPEIAGLVAISYNRLKNEGLTPDSTRDDKVAAALAKDLMGTCRYRLNHGLVSSDYNGHFLWDGPAAPDRSGATIESQVLFNKVRAFLKDYPRLEWLTPGLPRSLIMGVGGRLGDLAATPLITVGKAGEFFQPLPAQAALGMFIDGSSDWWADRLAEKPETADGESPRLLKALDERVAQLIAVDWNKPNDRRLAERILDHAESREMTGSTGYRSLSPFDADYQPGHVYLEETAPRGTVGNGDVLLWTCGMLADKYAATDQLDSLWTMIERLRERTLYQGATGGLAEAENSEPVDYLQEYTGNAIFAASTFEYIRAVCHRIFGYTPTHSPYMTLRPRFPESWGETRLEIQGQSGKIVLMREQDNMYRVKQSGVEPYLQLALEIVPEPGSRALGSLRLYPDAEAELEFVRSEKGQWKAKIRRQGK